MAGDFLMTCTDSVMCSIIVTVFHCAVFFHCAKATIQCDSVTTTCATHGGGDLLMTVNLREYKIPVSTSASHLNIDQGIP